MPDSITFLSRPRSNGDVVVLFIDGVTEMCNDAAEFFGVRGLEESSSNGHVDSEAMIDGPSPRSSDSQAVVHTTTIARSSS